MGKSLIIKGANFFENRVLDDGNSTVITVASNNNNYGTVSGGGRYEIGTQVVISATANSGYHFVEWNDGNTNATRTITVGDSPVTYTATFQEGGYGIITYGSTTLYELEGGTSNISMCSADSFGVTLNPVSPAQYDGLLNNIRMAFSQNKSVDIVIGTLDQNNFFIERTRAENVTINGDKTVTDVSSLNIRIRAGEIIVIRDRSDSGLNYSYYRILSDSDSNITIVNSDMSIRYRTDHIHITFYYTIDHDM